jgi:hypothetical protein
MVNYTMNEESKESPVAAEIVRALQSGDLPEQVADKPWLKEWQSTLTGFNTAIAAAWERISPQINVLKEALQEWEKQAPPIFEWADSHRTLLAEIHTLGPKLERMAQQVGHIGELGWTVQNDMELIDIFRLSEFDRPAEADAYMQKWYEQNDAELNKLEKSILEVQQLEPFHAVLSQCFESFRRGCFAITIPCLISVLEGSTLYLEIPQRFFSTDVEKNVRRKYKEAKAGTPDVVWVFWSLHEFVRALYGHYPPGKSNNNRLLRHGILHGRQAPPNEKTEVIRLFHVIGTVTELYDLPRDGR